MAKCKVCGARYNKADVEEEILQVCHIWSDSDFGGLCFDCALNNFVELEFTIQSRSKPKS